ncbi:MAG: class I SAM-dependent methyltransferase [Chloroflexota bacterium]
MSKNKYEELYKQGDNVCGEPFAEFEVFFQQYAKQSARVLDLGCGQGRDALFIARHGHQVTGVDVAPTGVEQMVAAAKAEGLVIEGIVADIVTFVPQEDFDVVVLDRVLHMLGTDEEKTAVLATAANHLHPNGHILIADMPKNIPLLRHFFDQHPAQWILKQPKKGLLFTQRKTQRDVQ